jgi:hypothetical protein
MSSHRLQVLIPPEMDAQIDKAAQRTRMSKGEWVRQAIQASLRPSIAGKSASREDPVARLAKLRAPTGDMEDVLAEIERGRR